MDELKSQILKLLSENARYTNSQIAKMLGETEQKIAETVKKLETDGVIVKYSAIINNEILENHNCVQALIEVKVSPQKLKGFDTYAEELYNFSEVTSLYLMSGGFDLAVFVEGKTLKDIARFVSEKLSVIDGITGVQTHFILKKYKIEGQVTQNNSEPQRQMVQA